jgi:hypothetical protein
MVALKSSLRFRIILSSAGMLLNLLLRGTILSLIRSDNREYKELTKAA